MHSSRRLLLHGSKRNGRTFLGGEEDKCSTTNTHTHRRAITSGSGKAHVSKRVARSPAVRRELTRTEEFGGGGGEEVVVVVVVSSGVVVMATQGETAGGGAPCV